MQYFRKKLVLAIIFHFFTKYFRCVLYSERIHLENCCL